MVSEDGGWEEDIWNISGGKDWVAAVAVEIISGRGGWQGELWVAGGRKEFSSSLSSNLPVVS